MKFKKTFLAFGTSSIIFAPFASVVSCHEHARLHPEWTSEGDLKWNGDGTNSLGILNLGQLREMNADLKRYPLAAADIFEWATNSKAHGITPITRLQDFATRPGYNADNRESWNPVLNDVIDQSVPGADGKDQALDQTDATTFASINALWSKKITKAQMLGNPNFIDQINQEVTDFASAHTTDKLGAFVVEDKKDALNDTTKSYDTGEYTLYIFQLKNTTSTEISNAKAMFLNKDKMSPDMDLLNTFGGTYLTGSGYGTVRLVSDPASALTIFAPTAHVNPFASPNYQDRASGSTIKDWFAFGPTMDKTDPNNPVMNITTAEMDGVKDVRYVMYYTKDKMTQVQTLVVSMSIGTITGTNPNQKYGITDLETIYIPVPEMMDTAPSTDYLSMSDNDLKTVTESIVNDLSFSKMFNMLKGINALKESIGSLAPSAMPSVIDIFAVLENMFTYQKAIQDLGAFRAFLTDVPTIDPTFKLSRYMQVIDNQKNKEFESFLSFGGKRYAVLDVVPRFYNDFKTFIGNHPEFAHLVIDLQTLNLPGPSNHSPAGGKHD